MTTSSSLRSSGVRAVSLFVALGALGFAACSSDENAAPSQPPTFGNGGSAGSSTGGSAGAAAGSGGGTAGSGTGGSTAGSGGTEAGGAAGSTAGGSAGTSSGGSAGTSSGGSGGCSTTPTTTTEFLNRCSDNSCTPFDNKTRIPGFTGTLPPLP